MTRQLKLLTRFSSSMLSLGGVGNRVLHRTVDIRFQLFPQRGSCMNNSSKQLSRHSLLPNRSFVTSLLEQNKHLQSEVIHMSCHYWCLSCNTTVLRLTASSNRWRNICAWKDYLVWSLLEASFMPSIPVVVSYLSWLRWGCNATPNPREGIKPTWEGLNFSMTVGVTRRWIFDTYTILKPSYCLAVQNLWTSHSVRKDFMRYTFDMRIHEMLSSSPRTAAGLSCPKLPSPDASMEMLTKPCQLLTNC